LNALPKNSRKSARTIGEGNAQELSLRGLQQEMLGTHLSQAALDGLRVEKHFPATALAAFDSGWAQV
jgi:hypothetical protein